MTSPAHLARLYRAGFSVKDIRAETGLGRDMICKLLREQGVPIRPRGRPVDSGTSVPTEKLVELYRAGKSCGKIGRLVGLHPATVRDRLERADVQFRGSSPVVGFAERPERVWCDQCERRVLSNEAGACQSRFCKAKQVAAGASA